MQRLDDKSRMSREAHVRICESVRVKFPRATRPIWLRIDLGFDFWVRQKVRLRSIDAPELDTKEGRSAKRFVENQLKNIPCVMVTTTKPDKFDRYLSDLWFTEGGDAVNLNQLLLESGHARRKTEFSAGDWTLDNWGRF